MAGKGASPRVSPVAQARIAREHQRRQAALDLLGALDCLCDVSVDELLRLLDLGVVRAFAPGATIFGKQKRDRFAFIVLRGNLQLRLRDRDGHEVLVAVLGPGDSCGEGPLFGDFFRRMSAQASTHCVLLQLPLAELRDSLSMMPTFAAQLRQIYTHRLLECTLARIPLLSQLLPVERLALADSLHPSSFSRGSLIIRQGDTANALYLIENGQAIVEQYGQTVATLGEGDFFGEIALLTSQPHQASVRALTPTDVLALPSADFHVLVRERPQLEASLRAVIDLRNHHNAAVHQDQARARDLTQAVARGLLRGTHLLVRAPSLCPPGCQICEEACIGRHGHQRLALHGTLVDDLDVLDACRQCSVGPECAEACPTGAFERTEEGVLRITASCTGCGACVPACPYHAIASVPHEVPPDMAGPLWSLLHQIRDRLRPQPVIPLAPARRADKCDLCHSYGDQACISACPTGALRLVPVSEMFPS
ncbi:MAG: cyclic nucleotide-binding domain-containing protein [Oscillochloris sp.]|nr:cyclic nucleotide-binding domain-containing protein [Oscillochloris sp.]